MSSNIRKTLQYHTYFRAIW